MDGTLKATRFIDKDSPVILEFAAAHAGHGDDVSKAVNLYYVLRDAISYDMRTFGLDPGLFVASNVLQSGAAFCVPKAVALAALARAVGIPSRIGFANVRNHLASPKLLALMDGDIFRWHAYTSLYIDGKWQKATPAFDIGLCNRHGVAALDFNGREDSIFQPYDEKGRPHMEYVDFIGEFDDMPYDGFADAMRTYHSRLLDALAKDRENAERPDH
jgi:transglutaminase-like putative cysteine protease